MALPDITRLTIPELEKLLRRSNARLETLRKSRKKKVSKVRRKTSKVKGAKVGGAVRAPGAARKAARRKTARRTTRAKAAPKYRNPANPKETWMGRGRRPLWLVSALESGRALEDLLIR